jgi:hypothetical protein
MAVSRDAEHRHLNRSLVWIALEERQLAEQPMCACGAPAVEAHRSAGDCFAVGDGHDYTTDELVSVCQACHDALCSTRTRTPFDRWIDSWL